MVVSRAAAVTSINKGRPKRVAVRKTKSVNLNENIGCGGNLRHDAVAKWFRGIRDASWFQSAIIGVIFVAGALVGIQTYEIQDDSITTLDDIVLGIFVMELVVKFIAEGKRPHWFFKDAWNVFDFLVVLASFLPIGGGNAVTALRLVRLLRVLKLVRALPKLRILVMGLLKSMSSIAYIGLLLGLLFYLYAVLGVILFSANDPVTMGTLHIAFLTLFRCATLEDWTDVMYTAMYGCEDYGYGGIEDLCVKSSKQPFFSVAYFVSFIILSSMMILNLFIGVITSSMQDAKTELMAELEAERAAKQEDADKGVEMQLKQFGELLATVEEEVTAYAALEKERKASSLVTLSAKNVLINHEVSVTAKDVDKVEKALRSAASVGPAGAASWRRTPEVGGGSVDKKSSPGS
uniref:Ion transport domain-containing protein n=1 Tax=Bicosoecida sp. CB-2014 TaxID=1486930 RepID=A0A7S1CLA3_9STRA|mmetsp:Transcript_3115/g.11154  ORF Transcript_3115/g.11154 Transcript_3115/m.11154 type:complete len:405 (+) Transcript_3115:269-1483(+)